MTLDTSSSDALEKSVRDRLLTFDPPGAGRTMTTILGGRLHRDRAPDNETYPYGVFRLTNRVAQGVIGNFRLVMDCELTIYGNADAGRDAVIEAADTADQAMLSWLDGSGGVVFSGPGPLRSPLPRGRDAEHREFEAERMVYPLVVWPTFLTQYGVAAG